MDLGLVHIAVQVGRPIECLRDGLPEVRLENVEVSAGHLLQTHIAASVAVRPKVESVVSGVQHRDTVAALVQHHCVPVGRVGLAVASGPLQPAVGTANFHRCLPGCVVGLGPHDDTVVVQVVVLPSRRAVEVRRHEPVGRILVLTTCNFCRNLKPQQGVFISHVVRLGVVRQGDVALFQERQRRVQWKRGGLACLSSNSERPRHRRQGFASVVPNAHDRVFAHGVEAGHQLVLAGRQNVHDFDVVRHVGRTVANDLTFHAVIPIRVVGDVVLHREAVLPRHQRCELQVFGADRGAWTPSGPVVDPRASLRVQRIVCAFLHDLPTPLLRAVHIHAVRVVAEFRAVVALSEVVSAGPGLQAPLRLAVFWRVGVGQHGVVPVAQVMQPFPKRVHALHITRRGSFDEGKLQIQELLPVAALQLHAVPKQGRIIRHIKHPSPSVAVQGKVDAIRGDVTGELVPVHHLERHPEIIERLVVVHGGRPHHRMDSQGVALGVQDRRAGSNRPSIVQVRPRHVVSVHAPLGHRHRGHGHRLGEHRLGERAGRLFASHQHQGRTDVRSHRIQERLARTKRPTGCIPVQPPIERTLVGGFPVRAGHVQRPDKVVDFRVIQQTIQLGHIAPRADDFACERRTPDAEGRNAAVIVHIPITRATEVHAYDFSDDIVFAIP